MEWGSFIRTGYNEHAEYVVIRSELKHGGYRRVWNQSDSVWMHRAKYVGETVGALASRDNGERGTGGVPALPVEWRRQQGWRFRGRVTARKHYHRAEGRDSCGCVDYNRFIYQKCEGIIRRKDAQSSLQGGRGSRLGQHSATGRDRLPHSDHRFYGLEWIWFCRNLCY